MSLRIPDSLLLSLPDQLWPEYKSFSAPPPKPRRIVNVDEAREVMRPMTRADVLAVLPVGKWTFAQAITDRLDASLAVYVDEATLRRIMADLVQSGELVLERRRSRSPSCNNTHDVYFRVPVVTTAEAKVDVRGALAAALTDKPATVMVIRARAVISTGVDIERTESIVRAHLFALVAAGRAAIVSRPQAAPRFALPTEKPIEPVKRTAAAVPQCTRMKPSEMRALVLSVLSPNPKSADRVRDRMATIVGRDALPDLVGIHDLLLELAASGEVIAEHGHRARMGYRLRVGGVA
jgi:hypothetical protein